MPFFPPLEPGPITQEAQSTRYSRDTFSLRLLSSGFWAIYDSTHTYIGAVSDLAEVPEATAHLRLLADRDRQDAEAARFALLRRAEELSTLDQLDIEL